MPHNPLSKKEIITTKYFGHQPLTPPLILEEEHIHSALENSFLDLTMARTSSASGFFFQAWEALLVWRNWEKEWTGIPSCYIWAWCREPWTEGIAWQLLHLLPSALLLAVLCHHLTTYPKLVDLFHLQCPHPALHTYQKWIHKSNKHENTRDRRRQTTYWTIFRFRQEWHVKGKKVTYGTKAFYLRHEAPKRHKHYWSEDQIQNQCCKQT